MKTIVNENFILTMKANWIILIDMQIENVLNKFSFMMVLNPFDMKDQRAPGYDDYAAVMDTIRNLVLKYPKLLKIVNRVGDRDGKLRIFLSLSKYCYCDLSDEINGTEISKRILKETIAKHYADMLEKNMGKKQPTYFTNIFERMRKTESAAKAFLGESTVALGVRKEIWNANFSSVGLTPNKVDYWMFWKNPIRSSDFPVLIAGESGTGKEIVAAAIAHGNIKDDKEYLELNFGSIGENTAKSELFGHVKGAYTDAKEPKTGFLEKNKNGVIFLDELSRAPGKVQSLLLRVFDEGTFFKMGGEKQIRTKARFIGSIKNPEKVKELLAGGIGPTEDSMKENILPDLYNRFIYEIKIPPLRNRKQDLFKILERHIYSREEMEEQGELPEMLIRKVYREGEKYSEEEKERFRERIDEFLEITEQNEWNQGNVRELDKEWFGFKDGRYSSKTISLSTNSIESLIEKATDPQDPTVIDDVLDEVTRRACERALENSNGNKGKAAETLGIAKKTFRKHLKKD